MITANNISVTTKSGKKILDDFSVSVSPGILTSVIGKNGAGKSTCLKAICGESDYSVGDILFNDQNINKLKPGYLAKHRAVVSQKTTLDFSFSVEEVVTLGRAPFSGYIQNRFLDSGTVISPGLPILEIIDSTVAEAHVSVPSYIIESLVEGNSYNFLFDEKIFPATLKRFTKMSNQGSDNRLSIFEFNTFINPGSIAYLQLDQEKSTRGAWVPLKSLSQGTQGLWNLYTVTKENNNQFKVAKEIVELIHVEGDSAYISGTISTGDMVVSGGAEKVIENEILKVN